MKNLIKNIVTFFKKGWNNIQMFLFKRLLKLRSKLRLASLREAIEKADENKSRNGRKNIVVFNNVSGNFEPIEKRAMKRLKSKHQGNGSPKQTDYRKKRQKNLKPSRFTNELIHHLENKSAYVTK